MYLLAAEVFGIRCVDSHSKPCKQVGAGDACNGAIQNDVNYLNSRKSHRNDVIKVPRTFSVLVKRCFPISNYP